jgi:GDPmannose 4,6-dehydratase
MKAVIFGITGQDGTLLANFLLKKGYDVVGTTRDLNNIDNLIKLNIADKIKLRKVDILKFNEINEIIENEYPNEIYNLSGQTSVGNSYLLPLETYQSIIFTTMYILESIRNINSKIKFFNASSIECFGDNNKIITENTKHNPVSPYGTAKSMSQGLINNYRSIYGLHICSGILSNHESQLRSNKFVSQKIVDAAIDISKGVRDYLEVGDISIVRDWGWAEEYIEAMYKLMKIDIPDDYIIATGKSISLEEFINYTFNKFNLDYKKHIKINKSFIRTNEIKKINIDNSKIKSVLSWTPQVSVYQVIDKLVEYKRNNYQ